MNLALYIDHTNLKPTATSADIEKLCREALQHRFASVCINPSYVKRAAGILGHANLPVCTVVDFPLGANLTSTKAYEAENALSEGASEIDMVMNIGNFKDKKYERVEDDIERIKKVCGDKILKVIIETCYLNNDEIIEACKICVNSGADFVKTSTGFGSAGATLEHVRLMKETVGDKIRVKAAGGIKTREDAETMINAGADRLGTSSSLAIVGE